MLTPVMRSWRPRTRPHRYARSSSPHTPAAMLPGNCVTPRTIRTTLPPSWSMDTKSGMPALAIESFCISSINRLLFSSVERFFPNKMTPPGR